MRATKQALNVLGMSGTIEDKEELPEEYDLELSFRFSSLIEIAEGCDTADDLEAKIRQKQDKAQADFEEKKQRVDEQLKRFDLHDEVIVEHYDGETEKGEIREFTIDRGHVFYKISCKDRDRSIEVKDEFVEPLDAEVDIK